MFEDEAGCSHGASSRYSWRVVLSLIFNWVWAITLSYYFVLIIQNLLNGMKASF